MQWRYACILKLNAPIKATTTWHVQHSSDTFPSESLHAGYDLGQFRFMENIRHKATIFFFKVANPT